ncbi:MAG: multicopper oxidase domain-containing protein [Chloroflexi bacterium]|nr:multicopper oxidase domain-containing protein [Chloroflexota bacterium]
MQVTTVQEKENNWLASVGLGLGIVVGVLLFGLVVAQTGALNGLIGGGETAVSLPPNTLIYTAKAMRFRQTELHVKAGEAITIQLKNDDMYAHSLDIDELDLHVQMPANNQVIAQFIATESGEYTIYCAVPGHEQAGMVATLIVEAEENK